MYVGFSARYAGFGQHFRGSTSIDASRTERLDAFLFDLSLQHHFGAGLAAGLRVPVGSIRVEPTGGARDLRKELDAFLGSHR